MRDDGDTAHIYSAAACVVVSLRLLYWVLFTLAEYRSDCKRMAS